MGRRHQQEEDNETKDTVRTERGNDEVLSEKRVKLSQSFSEDFKPYDYTSASYSTVGEGHKVVESFHPHHSDVGEGRSVTQRSKVNMRSSQQSHTYRAPKRKKWTKTS